MLGFGCLRTPCQDSNSGGQANHMQSAGRLQEVIAELTLVLK